MRLLLDANVSWRLIAPLKIHFELCIHADFIGLPTPPKDIEIWNYALQNNLVIVTNDDDFIHLMDINGFPPKLVLLKTGNQSTKYIESLLIAHKQDICVLSESTEIGLLEIF
jgi:predicted nuclease of predicted toxin-antitoxin system